MKSDARVLIIGRDEMLLQTRKLILGTFFQVETAGRVSHATTLFAEHNFDLAVLCYSLSNDECQQVVDLIERQIPRPKVLAMRTSGWAGAVAGAHQEVSADDGPFALVKKVAEMLGVELKGVGGNVKSGDHRTPALRY